MPDIDRVVWAFDLYVRLCRSVVNFFALKWVTFDLNLKKYGLALRRMYLTLNEFSEGWSSDAASKQLTLDWSWARLSVWSVLWSSWVHVGFFWVLCSLPLPKTHWWVDCMRWIGPRCEWVGHCGALQRTGVQGGTCLYTHLLKFSNKMFLIQFLSFFKIESQ